MNLIDLSESQQELLHPLIRLKTNTTFDSLIVLRDVFTDLSVAYNTFSNAIKDVEDKLSSCYTIASSGVITQEATEALLLVRGNLPNSSNIVQAATAEQTATPALCCILELFFYFYVSEIAYRWEAVDIHDLPFPFTEVRGSIGTSKTRRNNFSLYHTLRAYISLGLLRVMETMLNVIKRVRNESDTLSLSLDKSVSCAISTFANQYVDTFDMDGSRLRREDDLSTLISNLRTFKHSQGYPSSPIRKHVDNVLKAFKEFQHSLDHEKGSLQAHAPDLNSKSVRKAKSRTLRAKVSLNKYIQELFDVAPDIQDLNDASLTVPIVSKSNKKANKNVKVPVINNLKFHNDFYKLEQQRLELLSSCLQIWIDNFIRSEKGIYSQLEILWDDILKFSPGNDFHKFENLITGAETSEAPKHSRILIPSDPGPINDYTTLQLNTYSQCPTPINELSDVEPEFLSTKTEKVQSESKILGNADKLPKNATENVSSQCVGYSLASVTSPDFTSQNSPNITLEIKDAHDACMITGDGRGRGDISRGHYLNELDDVQEKEAPGSGHTSVPTHVSTDLFLVDGTDKNEPKVKVLDRISKNPVNPTKVLIDADMSAGKDGMEHPMDLKGVIHYLKRTRERFDDYMIKYYNLYNDGLLNWSADGFDWLNASIEELMTIFEYHHVYPFDIHTQSTCDRSRRLPELSKDVIPMPRLKCTFEDSYMTNEQWCMLSLEIMIMTHRHISGFINHPCVSTSGGDSQLREYLLLNLGILEHILIKIRRMIEVFRNRLSISLESYSILDILLKPRDAFTDNSPHVCIHIMDVRYRVLLLIDSISKADMLFNDCRLSDTLDYYQWFYRQLHLVHLSLIQKLIRLIHRIDSVDISISSRWYKIINSTNPLQDLNESFKFVDAKKPENICNCILSSVCSSIGLVNSMKSLVTKKLNSDPNPLNIKEYLLQLLENMLDAEESDYELRNILEGKVDQDTPEKKNKGNEIKDNTRVSYKDFVVDTSIYEDENISVLAEIKQRKNFCMRTCRPLSRYNMVKYIVDQVISDNRDMKYTTNKYFKRKIDLIPLSRSWALEVPIILRIVECLHQYLSCDELCFSDVPEYFQGILYITSFMQTGVLPNFNLLKKEVKTDYADDLYQIPISAHSILASMAFWTLNVCSSPEKTEDMSPTEGKTGLQRTSDDTPGKLVETNEQHSTRNDSQNTSKSSAKEAGKGRKKSRDEMIGSAASDQGDLYKRVKLKELGIEYESKSKRLSELTVKQLFLFNQVPANMYYLPKGIGSLDAYLLFDFKRFISNRNLDSELLLPDYTLMKLNGLEFVDWSSTDKLKKLVKMQLKGMYLDRALNKVHLFISDLLNYHIPRDMSNSFRETDMYESLLIPSSVEREILAILYLRCTSGKFRNEMFDYLCSYVESVDQNALFYLLSLFNIFYALLFNITSHHSAVFDDALLEIDYDRNRGLPLINIYRFIVAQNAKLLVKKCVEHVREVTEGTEDGNTLLSHYLEDVTQMLRYECASSSNVWNNFLTFGEYPSLLANCCMVELKRSYYKDGPGIGLIMPNVMKFMLLQREFDVSYLLRTPAEDPNIQAARLLRCMFFSYFNPNLLVNGSREVLNSIKKSLVRALESKFHEVNDIIKAGIDSESWKRVNDESLHSTGVVDLLVVLQYSLRASFDLAAPTEWLILPFTNACESALESYFKNLVKLYSLKNLYALHNFVNSDPSERADIALSPNHGGRAGSSCPTPVEGNTRVSALDDINRNANEQNYGATILIQGSNEESPARGDDDDCTSAARSESKSVVDSPMTGLRDAEDISASVDDSMHRVFTLLIEDELAQIPMDKKKSRVWKTIKSNLLPKTLDFPGHLQEYVATMGFGNVMQDLTRVWNLEYISQQLIRMPDEISGYYYNQIRRRDDDYLTIHRLIGTVYESDPNNFFYFEPHQLVEMPHSRPSIDLTLAAQRLLKSTSTRVIKDLLVVICWKLVFVDFKRDLFGRLYNPTFQSWTLTRIIMKFPNTIYNFVNQIPKDYKSFCTESFLYIFVKAISYVLHLKVKNYRLTTEDSNVIRTDINTLSQVLGQHSINITLLNPLESFIRN